MERKRNANIEFLRLLSMLMILVMHGLQEIEALSLPDVWGGAYRFAKALCIVSVNVFILITGYFGIENRFKAKNLFRIVGVTWIYSVVMLSLIHI